MTCVHVVHIQLHVSCIHNHMAENLYNTKFIVANITKIVANDNQLHASYIVTSCKKQKIQQCKQNDSPLASKHWIHLNGHQIWNLPLATKLSFSFNSFLPLLFKSANLDHFYFSFFGCDFQFESLKTCSYKKLLGREE